MAPDFFQSKFLPAHPTMSHTNLFTAILKHAPNDDAQIVKIYQNRLQNKQIF